MRYAFPLEVDRTTFKGADYESWRQQETCPGPSIRGIVKSKLDKCMIHVDTFSSVPFYIGPEKYTGLPTPLIYSKPEVLVFKHSSAISDTY
uniref:Ras-GAP domain-containing protein n=1 Tax=Parascaris univalens TaxID=6257 RepID=A0A914ZWG2_PARUN